MKVRYRRFILIYMVALIYKVAASILDAFWVTHLHYCQRTTASENWFPRPAGYDLETDRKRDKWLNGKALKRTARTADQIHYCQLGKLASV